ncbi:DUF6663 family protein [Halobium salinum]|uniref:DUF6663 family protein n=1 Tax=Halobium salinum TaxID=1364940 RepID=A0ABD5PBN9_9EURY|nr:DUF6663 family protein [Halobium salinum]
MTTTGTYRVLDGPRDGDDWLLLDRETFDPLYVPRGDHGVDPAVLDDLEPGNLVDATVEWDGDEPRVTDLSVLKRTRFTFVDAVPELFSAAESTWQAALSAGEGMGSQTTHDTDGEPNGALYVFAEQPGAADLFAEFRDGERPLDPLVDRVNDQRDDDHDVFVLRPADGACVCVYVVFEKDGRLAGAVREKYGLDAEGSGSSGSGLSLSGLEEVDVPDGDYPTK